MGVVDNSELTSTNYPGWANCVFCGRPVAKADRTKEHVLPMWMLRATGDPKRMIKIETDPLSGADIVRPASTFHFPACHSCNHTYGKKLETQAKKALNALFAGKSLKVSQCYRLLDWLDKVRIGLWLGYNMLHKEAFQPKFRIDQRLGKKDRIAIISVDLKDRSLGFAVGGIDNNIFRTSQAGMYLRINNVRILSMSYDNFISRYAGMPYPKEVFARVDNSEMLAADVACDDYDLKQDWQEFAMPGVTIIAQAVFWPGGGAERWRTYFNRQTIGRLKNSLRLSRLDHLNSFFQTQLISNAGGRFRYYPNKRQRIRFGISLDNTDFNFVKALYILFWKHVLPLNPRRVIDQNGKRYGVIVLALLWLEKVIQIVFRLRQMGIEEPELTEELINEFQKVSRLREESVSHLHGTCVPESARTWS